MNTVEHRISKRNYSVEKYPNWRTEPEECIRHMWDIFKRSNTNIIGVSEEEKKMSPVQIKVGWKFSKSDKKQQHTNARYSANPM